MYVRDQFIRARPPVRAAARSRQAAQARIVFGLRPPMLDELGLAGARRAVGLADTGDVVSADGVIRWRPR
jgi:hypothetical protein